jgi:hypothetical protein
MLRVLMHYGTSASIFMEEMSRNTFFPRFEYHIFYVLYLFVTYLLTLPHMKEYKLSRNFDAERNERSVRTIIKKKMKYSIIRRELNRLKPRNECLERPVF